MYTSIGIELGSTRIKAVMADSCGSIIASGSSSWENSLKDGIWTYKMDEVKKGLRTCFSDLKKDYMEKTGKVLTHTDAIGISAMMHGYIALDENDELPVPFRTWRNTMTGEAADALSDLFDFNIPQRWTIAHLGQAILRKEEHLNRLDKVFTLASYVHYLLTGKRVIGIGDASGMFPIDSSTKNWNLNMKGSFKKWAHENGYDFRIDTLFPAVLTAGEDAGTLTEEGALLLDPDGDLEDGIKMVTPEGDAGTGMVATDSVRVQTGNVSAGTSDFAMFVVDHMPARHRELDMVTTPSGDAVAMVHCNNCTSDINWWAGIFRDFASKAGIRVDDNKLFTLLYSAPLEAEDDPSEYLSCNYFSGEGVTDFDRGVPLFIHTPSAKPSLASFMRCHMYSALATLKIGMDILKNENITIKSMLGHGGYFKSSDTGVRMLSAAIGSPVSVMETAAEGGAYGMALLALYGVTKEGYSLADWLDETIFKDSEVRTVMATDKEIADYEAFTASYTKLLSVERKTLEVF
ncbi:MAG: FGGY-family carbohydrate kinase [Bullifex sp.]